LFYLEVQYFLAERPALMLGPIFSVTTSRKSPLRRRFLIPYCACENVNGAPQQDKVSARGIPSFPAAQATPGCFLHAFHRTPSCKAILKYDTVPLPHRHALPHRHSLPHRYPLPYRSPPDSSNSLLQSSPEVSCKFPKVLRSKREIVLQWWYGLAEKDFSKL
jgi:hypothetical protein